MRSHLLTCSLVLACLLSVLSATGSAWQPAAARAANALPGATVRRYVNAQMPAGGGDGTSWATAYRYLQDALDEANADHLNLYEIWVAEGIYTPDEGGGRTDGDDTQSFRVEHGNVRLLGGFAAGESDPAARDIDAHPAVLSGDIDENDTTNIHGVVDTTDNIAGTNAVHVVVLAATSVPINRQTLIDGFTITAGHATPDGPHANGGGLYCDGLDNACSPTLQHVVFSGNLADGYGGGMIVVAAAAEGDNSPLLDQVTFAGNHADACGGLVIGAGGTATADPQLSHVTFVGNTADTHGGGMCSMTEGGGTSAPVLTDVTFRGNQADVGGGMSSESDEGVSSPVLTNVTFVGNSAGSYGGGMTHAAVTTAGGPRLTNVLFSGNKAIVGGGLCLEDYSGMSIVTNATFSANQADSMGGAIFSYGMSLDVSNLELTNAILWGNSGVQIQHSAGVTVTRSLVQGGFAGVGNLSTDPLFIRAPDPGLDLTWGTWDDDYGDLRLQAGSPAIDAGTNAAVPVSVTTDLAGRPRFLDYHGIPDTGEGASPIVDMGAYETGYMVSLPLVLRGG